MATVTACHYEFGAGQALAFGVPKSKHFQITFNYWANGQLHTGEFASEKAVPQGTLFPITYDPDAPHQHEHSATVPRTRLLPILLGAAFTLIAVCAVFIRGCAASH